jgi:hypothetical protein
VSFWKFGPFLDGSLEPSTQEMENNILHTIEVPP